MERKDWPVAVYRDFETPDGDDRAFYAALTPAERIRDHDRVADAGAP